MERPIERDSRIVPPYSREALYPDLLAMHLLRLMRSLQESAVLEYERKDIERRIIIQLGLFGSLSSKEIVALTGYEKAQISRAIQPLEQDGLMKRASLRAKFRLTESGQAAFERLDRVTRKRDLALKHGIAPDDLQRFAQLTEDLVHQVARVYDEERSLSAQSGLIIGGDSYAVTTNWPQGSDGEPVELKTNLLLPKLYGLVTYLRRSAMLVYQRTQGLSILQAQLLVVIGRNSPLAMAKLIAMMGRDKSQIGRTVTGLESRGLVNRLSQSGSREIALELTKQGETTYREMYSTALERDQILWSGHGAEDREFYAMIVGHLLERARVMIDGVKGKSPAF